MLPQPCFSFDVLKAQKSDGFSDEQAAYIAGSLLEGGSDTTSGILVGFIQAMMMFPEVQKKAQDLLDDVVGPERLPTLDDCAKVHYIQAIVKETIRWMPTIITGSPHANIQEDYYNGYRIPINSSIVNNVWYAPNYQSPSIPCTPLLTLDRTVNMDPKRNPNPRNFDPERFANDFQTEHQSATNKDENTRQNWIFGAGRRLCQGMHIAERSLLMGVSRMLWGFTFERGLDENGNVIPVDIDDLVGGIAVQPRDFKIRIIPRPGRAEVIRAAWRDAEENLLHPDTKQWIQVPEGMKFTTLVAEEKS
jgi:cytochrome P450